MPRRFSFHNVTFPSPQLTARMFPARLHDTRHTTSGNLPAAAALGAPEAVEGSRAVFTHGEVNESFVQINTVLSLKSRYLQTKNTGKKYFVTNLRCCCNITPWQTDIGCPCNITHPICVSIKCLFLHPRLRVFTVAPDFDKIVTTSASKTFEGCRRLCARLLRVNERSGLCRGRPRNRVAADGMTIEDVSTPLTVICYQMFVRDVSCE